MTLGKSFQKLFRRKSRNRDTGGDENGNRSSDPSVSDQLILKESRQVSTTTRFTRHAVTPSDLNEPMAQKVFAENKNYRVVQNYPPKAVTIGTKVRFGNDPVRGRNGTRVMPKSGDILNNNQRNQNKDVPHRSLGTISNKIFMLGERGSGLRARGDVQDFYKLRDELLESGNLFEDPDFPPTDSSLYYSQRADRRFEWKRPHEICENPQLFVEGYSRFDVQQGELGDCWLLAAVANLTLYRRLFFQVVPDDQSFDDKYAGIFHFRFWQYGRWIDVVIDDLLPTYNGQLVFLHSTEDNEFWSALLEKAYAKLHGSYEALKGGSTCEAMEDFTGGVTEMYEMNASPPNLFKIVLKAYERSSLMGCSLEPDPNVLEAETREGLIRGHAYSITRVKYVDIQTPNTSGKIPLLRLRNPWGNEAEWNGPWSDKSPEWRFIPESEKEELGLTFDDDGEFWMSFKDFQRYFDRLEICNLNPDSLTEDEIQEGNKKKWEVSFYEGEWVRGVTAGGCRNYLETFWHNPQYRVTLTEVDEGDEDGKCTLIVALMQKNRRSQRNMGIDVLTIGFAIYYLPNPDILPKPLNLNFFKYNASVARSPSFINLREVSCRFKLPPGTYCIVPSTFEPNEEGEFLLRVFSEHQNNMEENDEEIGYGEIDQRMRKEIFAPLHAVPILPVYASDDKTVRTVQPSPQEQQEKDQVYQFFLKLAGDDGEVDWMELKEILDYAMRIDAPTYRTDVKSVEAGGYRGYSNYPQQPQQQTPQDNSCCTQLLVIGGAALCCFLCMQLCRKNDNQTQTNTTNTLGPLATGCLANLCSENLMNTSNSANRDHSSNIDNQIVTTPPPSHLPADNYEMRNRGFSNDVCRSMVAMLDTDRSGKLGFEEFKSLWSDIRDWKNVFRLYDKDNSGTLDGFELRQALNSAGYHLNNHILNILMHRYGSKQGQLEFDNFIMCAVKLKTMIIKTGGISEQALIEEIQSDYQYGNNDRSVNIYTNKTYMPY
ncbi:hypothetical protein Trydic_g14875 [Trypoxylus dichotomus]